MSESDTERQRTIRRLVQGGAGLIAFAAVVLLLGPDEALALLRDLLEAAGLIGAPEAAPPATGG